MSTPKIDLKQINTIYLKSKLMMNPLNYTFKDKVILNDGTRSNSIIMYSKEELHLAMRLVEHRKVIMEAPPRLERYTSNESKIFRENNKLLGETRPLCSFLHNQNMYIDLHCLSMVVSTGAGLSEPINLNKHLIKNPEWIQPLLNLLVLLKDSKESIFKYIPLSYKESPLPFKELINLKFMKKDLLKFMKGESDNLYIFDWCDWWIPYGLTFPEWDEDISKSEKDITIFDLYMYCYQILAEMFYLIHNLKNTKIKEELLKLLDTYTTSNSFTDLMYNSLLDEDYTKYFKEIVNEHNPEERYVKIASLITNEEFIKDVETLKFDNLVPAFLTDVIYYISELNMQFMRIQSTKILLEICKMYKVFITDKESTDLVSTALLNETNIEETSTTLKPKEHSMFNRGHTYKEDDKEFKRLKSTDHTSSNKTIEELDKAFSEFEDGRYSFKIMNEIPKLESVLDSQKEAYDKIASSVSLINKNLIRKIKDIKVYNTGGKNSGLNKGKLDRKAIHKYKTTDKIFCNNTYKIKESDLAFGIILDVSGSMHGEGIRNGKATMIVLHETLKALGINHSIITHESGKMYQSRIRRYQLFKEDKGYSTNKNYNLCNITALYGNCDSGALYYMEQAMSRVRNKDKIVIMFSDGAPTECSGTDLINQVRHMERKGIKVIGVGIKYPKIAEYYTDYANGNNLKEMLDIVADILKQYVLDKKE